MDSIHRRGRQVAGLAFGTLAAAFALSVSVPAGGGAPLGPGGTLATASPSVRTAITRVLRSWAGRRLPEVDANWSGYQLLAARTGQRYTSAAASWVVAAASGAPGAVGTWVGIGGSCLDASCAHIDPSLVQLGTAAQVGPHGTPSYRAWYELVPAPPVAIPLPVAPGDVVRASLATDPGTAPGQPAAWRLDLAVVTPGGGGQSWSARLDYTSSLASAEWIEEAPSAVRPVAELALADYGVQPFLAIAANAVHPRLDLADALVAVDPHGQLSVPSRPASATGGFSTCWRTDHLPLPCLTSAR